MTSGISSCQGKDPAHLLAANGGESLTHTLDRRYGRRCFGLGCMNMLEAKVQHATQSGCVFAWFQSASNSVKAEILDVMGLGSGWGCQPSQSLAYTNDSICCTTFLGAKKLQVWHLHACTFEPFSTYQCLSSGRTGQNLWASQAGKC